MNGKVFAPKSSENYRILALSGAFIARIAWFPTEGIISQCNMILDNAE
jgi:hypothetical protein